jgi:hypothetical protein
VANSQKKRLKKLSPGDFAWHKNRQSLGQKCIGGGLGGLWGTCSKFNGATGPSRRQKIWLRSLNNKAKKTRVKVQRRNVKRLGQGKRDNDGAGGFVGIGGRGHM